MRTAMLIFLFFGAVAHADKYQQDCVSWEDYKKISQRIVLNLGEKNPSLCDPNSRFYRIIEALNLLRQLKFDGPVPPAPYNQGILGTEFYGRILRLAPNIQWGPNEQDMWTGQRLGVANCKSYGAYVSRIGDRMMYFCPDSFKDLAYNSATYFIATMLHETRHQEGNGHSHISCKGGRLNCDENIYRKGAYAVTVETYAKLGVMATNLHPSMSFLARRSAYNVSQRSFRQVSTEKLRSEGLIYLTDMSGKRIAYNHRVKTQAFFQHPPGLVSNMTDSRILLIPSNTVSLAEAPTKYNFQNPDDEDADGISDFLPIVHYWAASLEKKGTFKGGRSRQHGEWNMSAEIWGDELEVYRINNQSNDAKMWKLKLPAGKPLLFREIEGYSDYVYTHKFHVLNDLDQVFELHIPTELEGGGDPTIVEVPNKYPGFTYVIKAPFLAYQQEWSDAKEKWEKNKKNKGIDYPIPMPEVTYDTYLLDRQGFVHIESQGKFPYVPSLVGMMFQSMAGGSQQYPDYPSELGVIGD